MTLTQALAPAPPTVETRPAGGPGRPVWVRPAVIALLLGTGVLYVWDLAASGWANAFYSAAVQAGASSWKAFFYGSSDASNFITVDKTPASLWVMDISARIFGVNSWSILVPQALEGVAAVGVLYLTVRRWFGPAAGLLAGGVLALTPVAVLMFRFNNPDALLTLLLIGAAYAVTRALESASPRWLAFAGVLVGFGFLTKMLQALLVVPAFALVYLIAAPTGLGARIRHLLLAGVAMVVAGGWWVAIVSLVPAVDRPFIGGSQHNSVLELVFGYNGFGRLDGSETGSVGGGGGGTGSNWGPTGWTRLFTSDLAGQAAWLLPASLLLLGAGLWGHRRAPRTDRARAGYLLWGGWLLVTAGVFSFMRGIFHPYYLVALAPAIAAVVGVGAVELFGARRRPSAAVLLAGCLATTAVTGYVLLGRSSTWYPWLAAVVILAGLGLAAALLGIGRLPARVAAAVGIAGVVVALAAPAAYALNTAGTAHSGAIPSAGPAVSGGGPGGFGGAGGGRGGGFGGAAPGGTGPGAGGTTGNARGSGTAQNSGGGQPTGGGFGGGGPGGGFGGGMGGLLQATTPGAALVTALQVDADAYTWVAATVGANNAAGYQLAVDRPVMAIGGFNGTDPAPTLAQFQAYVAAGRIHYFIAGGGLGQSNTGGSDVGSQIASWVAAHYPAQTVGGATVYDVSSGAAA